jgi:hypothetical protein
MLLSFQTGRVTGGAGVCAVLIAERVTFCNYWMVISCVHYTMPFFIIIYAFVNHFYEIKNAVCTVIFAPYICMCYVIVSAAGTKGINHETVLHMFARRQKWSKLDVVVRFNLRFFVFSSISIYTSFFFF